MIEVGVTYELHMVTGATVIATVRAIKMNFDNTEYRALMVQSGNQPVYWVNFFTLMAWRQVQATA